MEEKDYIEASARTDIPDYSVVLGRLSDEYTLKILHGAMGMVTEAAEIMDALKKHLMYGKPLDLVNLSEELGDSEWYEALIYRALGLEPSEIRRTNIEKLRKRYPDKFTEHHALNRDLAAERETLE